MTFIKNNPWSMFILPGFILYTIFMILPLFTAVYYGFFEWSGLGPKIWIGLENYRSLFMDERISSIFRNAVGNNFKFVLAALFIIMPFQLVLAYMLDLKIVGYRFFEAIIFLPYVISTTIVGFISMLVFDPNIGVLNEFFSYMGWKHLMSAWFGDPDRAFFLLVLVIVWQGCAAGMFIFLSNLKSIPVELIEASLIDGASGKQRFRFIILPALGPALTNNIILGTIWGLTQFDIPFVIGGTQGGVNNSLDFMSLFFYRFAFGGSYFGETSMGFGAAISVVQFLIILSIAIIQVKIFNRFSTKYGESQI